MKRLRVFTILWLLIFAQSGYARGEDVAINVSTPILLHHCSANQGAPDDFCIGYMEASINFIFFYHFWLMINKYDFPEKEVCFPTDMTSIKAVYALRKYVAQKGLAMEDAMATLLKAFAEAFPCPQRQ